MKELQHNSIVIGLPDGWLDVSMIVMAGSPKDGHAPVMNLTWRPLGQSNSFEDFLRQQEANTQQAFSEANLQWVQRGARLLNELPAYDLVYNVIDPVIDLAMTYWQVFVHMDAVVFVITATDRRDRFENTKAMFAEAISRFRIAPDTSITHQG